MGAISKNDLLDIILSDTSYENNSAFDVLITEVREIRKIQEEMRQDLSAQKESEGTINEELANVKALLQEKSRVLEQHQLFLEKLDQRERAKNIIITGLPEREPFEQATTDKEKVSQVFSSMSTLDISGDYSFKRIGKSLSDRIRPILVTVSAEEVRDDIVSRAKNLKEAGAAFKRVRVKKDIHPAIRREWKRLFDAELMEKDKAENEGHKIWVDKKTRQLKRDDVVIDSWQPSFF